MNAEQYRALVNKLEAINEGPLDDGDETPKEKVEVERDLDEEGEELAPGAQDDVTGVDAQVAAQAAAPDLSKYKPNDGIPEIEARSLAAAHAIAAKKGLKVFRWCSTYKTNIKKPQQQQGGKQSTGKVDFAGQSSPLGGDKENPMSFAPNSNFGA